MIRWSERPDMVAFMLETVPGNSIDEVRRLFEERFGEPLSRSQDVNFCQRHGVRHGTCGGRFEKGHVPANKGRPVDEWASQEAQERMAAGRFKRGLGSPYNQRVPVGAERVGGGGYIEVKVALHKSPRSGGRNNDNWAAKHRLVWQEAHGMPVPAGHVVAFADRNRRNFNPDNLVAIPRPVWAVINRCKFDYWDAESLKVAAAKARLVMAARAAELGDRERIKEVASERSADRRGEETLQARPD